MSDKFGMGSLGIGPFSGMLDSMEFVKQAWSSLHLPDSLTPTMDLDEIDRRIADLKVVEQWLTMNLGMLRSSIQGMEIQRGTIAAIRAFGEAMSTPGEGGDATSRTIAAIGEMQRAAAAAAGTAATRAASGAGDAAHQASSAEADRRAERDADAGGDTDAADTTEQATPQASGQAPAQASGAAGPRPAGTPESLANDLSRAAVEAVNPAAWWKLLQSQFGQIAQAALAGSGRSAAGAASTPAQAGPAAKPSARRAAAAGAAPPRAAAPAAAARRRGRETAGAYKPPAAGGRGTGRTAKPPVRGAGSARKAKGKG